MQPTYRALYLFFRSGQNYGCRDFSVNIRPSLGVFVKTGIVLISQDLKAGTDVALKLAKEVRL